MPGLTRGGLTLALPTRTGARDETTCVAFMRVHSRDQPVAIFHRRRGHRRLGDGRGLFAGCLSVRQSCKACGCNGPGTREHVLAARRSAAGSPRNQRTVGPADASNVGRARARKGERLVWTAPPGAICLRPGISSSGIMRRDRHAVANTHVAVRMALAGFVFIGLFVLSRAASFHHLHEILGRGAPEFNWGSLQEMAGILLVTAAAALYKSRGDLPPTPAVQ